jgi:hypothetical protein
MQIEKWIASYGMELLNTAKSKSQAIPVTGLGGL